ncbi:Post-segregation antitoxin CcdA [Burkholderiales bacterium]
MPPTQTTHHERTGACDNDVRDLVRREQEHKWRADHADFISTYNATVDAEGLPLGEWRTCQFAGF